MIGRVKTGWRLLEASRPGRRFQDRYRRRQQSVRGFHPSRILYVIGGLALMVVSAFFGWLPILGWGTVVLGLGMIAGEFRPAAWLMDRLEVRLRKVFAPVAKAFRRLNPWAQLAVSTCIALLTFALMYGVYSASFGG
ncbi:hypothetical protein [Rubrobacter aplysinae]|uniref:hypothetical protein n=1 Tax=Rubrobacter aplysinae TaxID=909625 RepID=UPI00064BEC45|nr:hypothetical protein [Rubrobacter aplysinae]